MKSREPNALISTRIMLKSPNPINNDIATAIGPEKFPPTALIYNNGGKISPAIERPTPRITSAAFNAQGNEPSNIPKMQMMAAKNMRSFQYFNFRFAFNLVFSG